MNPTKRAYIELHIAVLLFGFTAILGDLITLSTVVLVWWRVLIASVSILFLIQFGRKLREIPRRLVLQYMGIGVLVGLHWICFFGSIKYANASICLICMATTSFFTSFIEPLVMRKPFNWIDVGLGMLVIPGMVLVINSTELSMMTGIWIGLLSALLAAIFATLNKKLVNEADTFSITFLELGSAWLSITIALPFFFSYNSEAAFWPVGYDWIYIGVLALLCTTFAYYLSLRALKYISAFAANLTINLEPVYGIILAGLILKEHEKLTTDFYWGGLLILAVVFSYPWLKRRLS